MAACPIAWPTTCPASMPLLLGLFLLKIFCPYWTIWFGAWLGGNTLLYCWNLLYPSAPPSFIYCSPSLSVAMLHPTRETGPPFKLMGLGVF